MHLPSSSPSSRLSRTSARSATGPSEHQERVWVKETRGRRRLIGLTNTPRAAISSTLDWVRILPVLKTTPHTALMINRRLYCNTETVQPGIKPELLPLIISLVGDERFAKRHQHTHTHTQVCCWYSDILHLTSSNFAYTLHLDAWETVMCLCARSYLTFACVSYYIKVS